MHDAWDPKQYGKFAAERRQPFDDLLSLIRDRPIGDAVDLGCGPGDLTSAASIELGCRTMLGIDNSAAMLAKAAEYGSVPGSVTVAFEHGDIATWTGDRDVDLVLAAASMQWVPNHGDVLARWVAALRPGGQIAVQVPANSGHPSHIIATEVANLDRFAEAFGEQGPPDDPVANNVFEPEEYAQVLFDLGLADQHVRLQVYPHVLGSSRDVVEWVRGTTLTRFQKRLDADTFTEFVAVYERRLLERIGEQSPYFFPFRRILMWGQRAR